MNSKEFGKRVALIREDVLKISQGELAEKLNTYQATISRLEKGQGGGTTQLILDFVSFLDKNNLWGSMIFSEKFSVDLLYRKKEFKNQDLTVTISKLEKHLVSLSAQLKEIKNGKYI